MDVIVVDAIKVSVKVGDEVILLEKTMPADEAAIKIGTTSYEMLTRINPLIPRIYA